MWHTFVAPNFAIPDFARSSPHPVHVEWNTEDTSTSSGGRWSLTSVSVQIREGTCTLTPANTRACVHGVSLSGHRYRTCQRPGPATSPEAVQKQPYVYPGTTADNCGGDFRPGPMRWGGKSAYGDRRLHTHVALVLRLLQLPLPRFLRLEPLPPDAHTFQYPGVRLSSLTTDNAT